MRIKNIIIISLMLIVFLTLTLMVTTCTGSTFKTGAYVPFEYAVPDGMITDPAEKETMIEAKIANLRETNKIFWGDLPSDTDVLIKGFHAAYGFIRTNFAGFEGLDIDFDKYGDESFERIEEGLNDYGEFAYMLTYMSHILQEGHSTIATKRIRGSSWMTPYREHVPMINTDSKFSRIGACYTVTEKEELIITRLTVDSDNPYNFRPGDEIVGFNGIPWSEWYPILLESGIPIYGSAGASQAAIRYNMLRSGMINAFLFEKINIKRYGKEEIETLPLKFTTFNIGNFNDPCMEYYGDVPGVKTPKSSIFQGRGDIITYGIVKDKNIGYIYITECPSSWEEFDDPKKWNPLETEFSKQFSGVITGMKDTDGIIIDMRYNLGGRNEVFYKGLTKLVDTNKDIPMFAMLDRDSEDPDIRGLELPSSSSIEIKFPADNEKYTKPIIILTGPDCISAGDFLIAFFARFPEFKIIGRDNNASFAGVSGQDHDIGGGDVIHLYVTSQIGFYIKDEDKIVYNGPTIEEIKAMKDIKQRNSATKAFIKANYEPLLRRQDFIDEYVWFTKEDVVKGIDTVREKAFALIKEGKN